MDATTWGNPEVRRKIEVYWTGLSVPLTAGVEFDFVNFVKNLPAPQIGKLDPFFNVVTDKLNVFNEDSDLYFKANFDVTWASSANRRAISLEFFGTRHNYIGQAREISGVDTTMSLHTMLSIDKNDYLAESGCPILCEVWNTDCTLNNLLIIVSQRSFNPNISKA